MWFTPLLILPLVLHITAIKVPIHAEEQAPTEVIPASRQKYTTNPIFQGEKEQSTTDSYQVQPEEQPEASTRAESSQDGISAPARYLLPPRPDAEVYSYPTEPPADGDWTPMLQNLPKVAAGAPFVHKFAVSEDETRIKDSYGTTIQLEQELPKEEFGQWFNAELAAAEEDQKEEEAASDAEPSVPAPSRELQPPHPDSSASYDTSGPATELKPPQLKPTNILRQHLRKLVPILPTISLEMKPPTLLPKKYRGATVLYPKKYSKLKVYKPIPIPTRYEGDILEVPKARPVKFFKPELNEEDYVIPQDEEKKMIKFQQAEEKKQFKKEEEAKQQQEYVDAAVVGAFAQEPASEQETSETGFYGDSRDGYAAPLPAHAPVAEEPPAPAERTEFRMHGLQGPNSYKFGYDTGRGKNRQFRYEERNNEGHVRGHYGYVDHRGKTHVVNYDAHPERGFHAEGPFGKV